MAKDYSQRWSIQLLAFYRVAMFALLTLNQEKESSNSKENTKAISILKQIYNNFSQLIRSTVQIVSMLKV